MLGLARFTYHHLLHKRLRDVKQRRSESDVLSMRRRWHEPFTQSEERGVIFSVQRLLQLLSFKLWQEDVTIVGCLDIKCEDVEDKQLLYCKSISERSQLENVCFIYVRI